MTTEILCRFDPAKQAAVVFLSDTINGKQIQAWSGEGKPHYVPLDYYHMTAPLSANDEKVLMERFKTATGKQDQVVHIRQRLPRQQRKLPNLLTTGGGELKDVNPPPAARKGNQRKAGALSIEAQFLPAAPQGAPAPGEGLTPAPPVKSLAEARTGLPAANELPSTILWAKIEQLNARMQELAANVAGLTHQLADANTDLATTKEACTQVIAEYNAAIEAEAAEALRKRQQMLAQLTATVGAPLAPATPPAPEAPASNTAPAEAAKPRGNGGRFVKKGEAPRPPFPAPDAKK
jgi:hypothetical protein